MDAAQLKAAGFSDDEIKLHQAGFSDDEIKAHNTRAAGIAARVAARGKPNALTAASDLAIHGATLGLDNVATPALMAGTQGVFRALKSGDIGEIGRTYSDEAQAGRQYREQEQASFPHASLMGDIVGALGGVAAGTAPMAPAAARAAQTAARAGASAVSRVTGAGTRANAASDTMRGEAQSALSATQSTAEADAAAAAARAQRASALATRARAAGKTLNARSAEAAAQAAPPVPDIGAPSQLSDIGDSIRDPAMAQQDTLNASMREADAKYRDAMDKVAADRAASGVGVSDSVAARALIRKSKALVEPDPVARPSVGSVPADSAGGKLHRGLLDVLQPKEVPLTVNEAKRAARAGIKVNTAPDGSFTRTVKPDLASVDDFRRFVGKVLDGKVDGYEGINRAQASQMYGDLSNVIDKYVKGASKPVQANWAAGKRALAPFERVRAGQAVVGTQGGTDVASVPAANIPGRLIAGGRDTVQQVGAVAGQAPVAAAVRSQVQNALTGAKDADAMSALVRPGTKLGDVVASDGDLHSAVSDYIQRVRGAEQSGAQAKDLGARAATNVGRAKVLDKAAAALNGTSEAAVQTARQAQQDLAALEIAAPREVGSKYVSLLNKSHASGAITTEQLQSGLRLAASAEKDFALKATRDRWLKSAAVALGVGSLPLGAISLGHAGK